LASESTPQRASIGARLNPAANDNNTGFTGHLKDDASGLVYMQARYYAPPHRKVLRD